MDMQIGKVSFSYFTKFHFRQSVPMSSHIRISCPRKMSNTSRWSSPSIISNKCKKIWKTWTPNTSTLSTRSKVSSRKFNRSLKITLSSAIAISGLSTKMTLLSLRLTYETPTRDCKAPLMTTKIPILLG